MRLDRRLLRAIGAVLALGCLSLWMVAVWLNPYAPLDRPASRLVAYAMMGLWLLGGLVAIREHFAWQLVVSLVAFVPVGFYLLLTPGIFSLIGVMNLVYLAAAVAFRVGSREGRHDDAP